MLDPPSESRRLPLLGELESAVMDFLWAQGEADPKAVHAALGPSRRITLNTIQSTLKRLFEKGLLTREKVSHAHLYRPTSTREGYHQTLIGTLAGGDPESLVAAFVDMAERAGPEHLARLEALVTARRKLLRKRGGAA